jgi:hypothetical protein
MKVKKEYILLVAIILALSIYLLKRNTNKLSYQLPSLSNIPIENISKVEISGLGNHIVLKKKDKKWYIGTMNYLADSNKTKDILDVIGRLSLTALVSESKEYSRYHLHDNKKISVKAWVGDSIKREFMIGKVASSYQHTFVKISGDHRVYHATGNFRGKFDQTIDKLRDKLVLSFEKKDIHEIKITKGNQSLVYKREPVAVLVDPMNTKKEPASSSEIPEPAWKRSDNENVDQSSLESFLDTLSHLRCDSYIPNKTKDDFTKPLRSILLVGKDKYTLSIFPELEKESEKYPALSSEKDYPFLLTKLQVENIIKKSGWPDKEFDKP